MEPSPEFYAKFKERIFGARPQAETPAARAARLAREKWEERQRNLAAEYRQQAIDAVWERTLQEKAEAEARAMARSFHKGPGDADWRVR